VISPETPAETDRSWAIVTGGSRGIGRAIVLDLARAGYDVLLLYRRCHEAAEETRASACALGVAAESVCLDLAQPDVVTSALGDHVARLGRISILVNCAGINQDRTLHKLSPDEWHAVIATNLTAAFYCTQAVVDHMRQHNYGRIVNMSSIIGQTGNVGQSNYSASKAGLIGFTKSVALETARFDITVNAVCPGFIDTDMLKSVPEEAKERLLARIPKERFGTPDDVARVVSFLVEPQAGYITGAVVNVNGGLYM